MKKQRFSANGPSRPTFSVALTMVLVLGLSLALALFLKLPSLRAQTALIFVDADAIGNNDGSSWTDAYNHLQDALDEAKAAFNLDHEIWVAEGVYYPDEGAGHADGDRTEYFRLEYNNVRLYGGFAGGETQRRQRDWQDNPTVLSGDIDQNDTNTDGNNIAEGWNDVAGNNTYHVLWLDGTTHEDITTGTVIDGFIVTAGQANAAVVAQYGGGIYCDGYGTGHECSPTLRNITFCGNQGQCGGAIINDGDNWGTSNPVVTNVVFSSNLADLDGGGMYNFGANQYGSESSPVLTNVVFEDNHAQKNGGGMCNMGANKGTSSPVLTNVLFVNNRADSDADDDGFGGGMYNHSGSAGNCNPIIKNVTFYGNQAYLGGGMYNYDFGLGECCPGVTNVILWGNSATQGGSQVYNDNGDPSFSHCDIQGCGGSGSWDTDIGTDNGYNIDADPLFADAAGGDLTLRPGSPAVDAGDTSVLPADTQDLDNDGDSAEAIPYDLNGNKRVQASAVDIGAYETKIGSGPAVNLLLLN